MGIDNFEDYSGKLNKILDNLDDFCVSINRDDDSDVDGEGPPRPCDADPRIVLGGEMTACLHSLAKDLKDVHTVLV